MRIPNLLATRWGRLIAFHLLYVTEGIPLGFTATAIGTQMRRQGVDPAAIGVFVGTLYLPWAWKWLAGPAVDILGSRRFGPRRVWIVAMQIGMIATLLAASGVDFVGNLRLFTSVIFIHNLFGAVQDVAIDALAVNTLHKDERGLANGLMFAGASFGQAIGGSGVLFLAPHIGFLNTFYFVAGAIALVTLFVALPLREQLGADNADPAEPPLKRMGRETAAYAKVLVRSLLLNRTSIVSAVYSLLPAGSYALGLALQTTLAVELGLDDNQVAWLNLYSTIIFAVGCVGGGFISDKFGRRRMLALYTLATAIPAAWLGLLMHQQGWIMPIDPTMENRPSPPDSLVRAFWTAVMAYNFVNGLLYGTRSALLMDVTTPEVAATQFTAYMAMQNLVIGYTSTWQGFTIVKYGYPTTLGIDAVVGLIGLCLLPFMVPRADNVDSPDI